MFSLQDLNAIDKLSESEYINEGKELIKLSEYDGTNMNKCLSQKMAISVQVNKIERVSLIFDKMHE